VIDTARDIYALKRRAGVRKTIGGLDYTRCVEYPAVLHRLNLGAANRVLEVGSSKLFLAPYIAIRHGVETHATDQDPVVDLQRRWIERLGHRDLLESGRFVVAREDATQLSYPDGHFDRIVCVSTIEHIRRVELAAAEFNRVLAPGGLVGLTVPFSTDFREVFVNGTVYGRKSDGWPQFYEYIFDRPTLDRRLIGPSGLEVVDLTFLGEPGIKLSKLVYGRLGKPLSLLRSLWPYTAHRFLRPIGEERVTSGVENIAVLVLRKPAST